MKSKSVKILTLSVFIILITGTTNPICLEIILGTNTNFPLVTSQAKENKPGMEWDYTFGGSNQDFAHGLIHTTDQGFAFIGTTRDDHTDAWLIKTDVNGILEWDQYYGEPLGDDPSSLIQTLDGGFAFAGDHMTETYEGNRLKSWVVKIKENGIVDWDRSFRGFDATSIIQTSENNLGIVGTAWETAELTIEDQTHTIEHMDFWLLLLDLDGNMIWDRTYGCTTRDPADTLIHTLQRAYTLVESSDGGYTLAGITESQDKYLDLWVVHTDINGVELWNNTYGGYGSERVHDLIQTSDGGYALLGETNSYGEGGDEFWLIKLGSSGNLEWNKTYGGPYSDEGNSLIQSSDGGFVLVGTTTTSFVIGQSIDTDIWVVKTDSNGNKQWDLSLGGSDQESGEAIVETSNGDFVLLGTTYSFGAGRSDMWLVKISNSSVEDTNDSYLGIGILKELGILMILIYSFKTLTRKLKHK